MTKTEAIGSFLGVSTLEDLSKLYTPEMEVQVNVHQANGSKIISEFKGRKWSGYTDNVNTWKSFRIPYNASTEPIFDDSPITFDLFRYTDGIGMTGWNFAKKQSIYVAFDFDNITSHACGISEIELEKVKNKACELPYVTVRYSTSGNGIHLYVFLDQVTTKNHTEHAAVARSVLSKMCADTGFDFKSKVDACGGNIWIWHRKMHGTKGLQLVKSGTQLCPVPKNWREHIDVVAKKSTRIVPSFITDYQAFEKLVGQSHKIPLNQQHMELIKALEERNAMCWWDSDFGMLVAHTYDLKEVHAELGLQGIYDTVATGSEQGADINCFLFPMRNGAWVVRRYTKGIQEANCWDTDSSGWTRTYLNKKPTISMICKAFGAIEDEKTGFIFSEASVACEAAMYLGVVITLPIFMSRRQTSFKEHKDGRLIIKIKREDSDNPNEMENWLPTKDKHFTRIYQINSDRQLEEDTGNYDDLIRYLVNEQGEPHSWYLNTGRWQSSNSQDIKLALTCLGYKDQQISKMLGSCVMRSWKLVHQPFQPEYIGDREWNRKAPQLRFPVSIHSENLSYPTWSEILNHCGQGLNEAISADPWCQANGILTGGDYLKCWIASLFKDPTAPLPYLFFYGEQKTGKTTFHEALNLLMVGGYCKADAALTNQQGFNAELESSVLCAIEETDLNKNKLAYNRVKDWVTSKRISIHPKGKTPYTIVNTTHWVHCSNEIEACPIFPGDTRITMVRVPRFERIIVPKILTARLEKEAPDFLSEILNLELPSSDDRLAVPIVTTREKLSIEKSSSSKIDLFFKEKCFYVPGKTITIEDLYGEFLKYIDPDEIPQYTKIRFGKEAPTHIYPKGRRRGDAKWCYGNISFNKDDEPTTKLVEVGSYLEVGK